MTSDLSTLYAEHLETLEKRFDRAMEETGFDAVVIYSGSLRMRFLDDMPYPFYTNPHFKTWVPLVQEPECFVVYVAGAPRPRVIFHQPVDYWHKVPETPEGFWVTQVDLDIVSSDEQSRERIEQALGRDRKVAFLGEWQGRFEPWLAAEANPRGLVERLHFDRAWKTDYEIECLLRANEIGARGHLAARDAFMAGASEYEIHLEYLRATDQNEVGLPYGNIIALNENAAVLHYQVQKRERPGAERHSFLIDAGASFNGYASDITRTWAAEDGEFRELIDRMDRAQLEMADQVRPGLDYREFHIDAHRLVAKILHEMDLVSMDPQEMVETGVSGKFFPHGIGHYIGLQVHDVGGFSSDREGSPIPRPEGHPYLRLTRKIEPRQVFTIEPGLYFIDSLLEELRQGEHHEAVNWSRVDSMRKYGGVRIEDNVVVTEDGHRNLTREVLTT